MASQIIRTLKNPVQTSTQTRSFARWVPYKPSPKPKLHQNLLTIATLRAHLLDSYLVSPFPCHGFTANQFKPLKSPTTKSSSSTSSASSKVVVVKNTLASQALRGTPWEKLGECLRGMNSLLFVKRAEDVGPAMAEVKARVKEGRMEFNEMSGAMILQGADVYAHLDLKLLESAPSRVEANALVLQSLFGPSSTLMAVLEGEGEGEGESS
ncbi:hypothetical protein vseg_019537 [Gypsophila vaccaria]